MAGNETTAAMALPPQPVRYGWTQGAERITLLVTDSLHHGTAW